jgi:TP901 family phage tail tape measure protein
MADLNSIIRIIFSGEDQLSGVARGAAGQISALGDVATSIASPFADLANKILLVDTAIVGIAAVIGTKAVQASSQFGASLSDLNRFLSEGEGDASAYRQTFENLSVQYGTGINEIVASTADWKAANFDLNQSLDLTRIALDYAIAGQIEAGEATDLLKKIISGMAVEQDKATEASKRFGDVINYIADSSTVNFKELALGVAEISPSINQTGASFEQITGIIAALTDVTQSGSQSASALAVIMGQLKSPSNQAEAALKEFGLTVDSNGVTQQSFYEILSKVAAKWPELTSAEKASYAQRLVSAEQVDEFSAIMNNWGKATEYATGAVANATGSMAAEVSRSLETSEKAFKSFGAAIDIAFIGLGDQIEPGVVKVTNSLKDLVLEFGNLAKLDNSPFEPLFKVFDGLATEISTVVDAISLNLDDALNRVDFSGLTDALGDLFGEIDKLFKTFAGDIDLKTVDGLAEGLQKIVDVGEYLVRTTQGIVSAFEPFADAAGRAVDQFTRLDSASQLDFGKFIGSAKLLIDAGIGIGGALIAIGNAGLDMKVVMDFVFGAVKVAENTVQIAFDELTLVVVGSAIKIAEATRAAFSAIGDDEAVADIDKALAKLNATFDGATKAIEQNKAELEGGWKQAIGSAANETEALRGTLTKTGESLKAIGDSAKDGSGGIKVVAEELQKLKAITLDKIEVAPFLPSAEAAEAAGQLTRVGDAAQQLVPKLVTVRDANGKVVQSYTEMVPAVSKAGGTLSIIGSEFDKAGGKAKDAAKESDQFRIKMEEIASNERIKTIEAVISLNIAALESDTKKVEAAFKSIDNTISSTGDLLSSLFGNLKGATWFDRLEIIEQIKFEREMREKAFKLQKELVEAQIEMMEARTAALYRGDSLIKVDGTGLKPHLEAMMWEVFSAIQIRANSTFNEFLLGLPTAAP